MEEYWWKYKNEGVAKGLSLQSFGSLYNIPYNAFEKYLKTRRYFSTAHKIQITGVPELEESETNSEQPVAEVKEHTLPEKGSKATPIRILVDIRMTNGINIRQKNLDLYSGESGAEMATIIGNPLSRIIKKAKTVYYVPSGIFHKLAIEAIPQGEQRLGDNHSFYRLSSARELADGTLANMPGSAQIYGGLTYGEDIKPLARSLQEVEDISNTLTASMTPQKVTADKGTKESFIQLSCNAPDIIHLSTHGFYYTPADNNLPASLKGYNDAMSLSGLVMSGGSLSSRQGLLTADEVAQCNLSNTAIACLASCHSGQGEVTSEWIYGLQRAFKKAGTKSVIMNLWEASDVATEFFMTDFYSDLVNGSKDRHKAFEFAQNEVRKKYPSPFYWAGFIMID